MSEGLNKVLLIGRLGLDPELKYTQGGQAVLRMRLATTERWSDKGEKKERTEWHTVIVWGNRAEALSKILTKGREVYIEGRIQSRSWEDKEGGKRTTTEIVANNLLLLGGGQQRDGQRESGGERQQHRGNGNGGGNRPAPRTPPPNDEPLDDFGGDDLPF